MRNRGQIQHGDVLLKKVATLPRGYRRLPRQNGLVIVAEGEQTGHSHTITDKGCTLLELKGEYYLEVAEPVTITHGEHKPLSIPIGIYQVGRVIEHDYLLDMERQVRD